MDQTQIIFFSSDLELPQMTLRQGYDTLLGHEQSLCEMRTYQVHP